MDCPAGRDVGPAERGSVAEIEHLGGLHLRYARAG